MEDTWTFTDEDLREAYRPWRDNVGVPVDYIYLGCPHASVFELQQILEYLDGRHIADNVDFWIGTCRAVRDQASLLGIQEKIEESGARIIVDSCMKVQRLKTRQRRRVMTAGTKVMWYWRSSKEDPKFGTPRLLGSTHECVETAIAGVFKPDWV